MVQCRLVTPRGTGSNPVISAKCWVNLLMVEAGCLSSIRCRFDSVTQYNMGQNATP